MSQSDSFIEFNLKDENTTKNLGASISKMVREGDCIALYGSLGAGKTTFSRGFIQNLLQIDTEVPSPTFTLLQNYEHNGLNIYHFDLYRLEDEEEVWELGWEEIIDGVSLIEWPQNAKSLLPKNRVEIFLEFEGNGRIAKIKIFGIETYIKYWQEKAADLKNELF